MNYSGSFFMIAALQPILKQRLIESARQRLIAKIEKKKKFKGNPAGTQTGDHELFGISCIQIYKY